MQMKWRTFFLLTLKREVGEEALVEVKLMIQKSNCRAFYYVIAIQGEYLSIMFSPKQTPIIDQLQTQRFSTSTKIRQSTFLLINRMSDQAMWCSTLIDQIQRSLDIYESGEFWRSARSTQSPYKILHLFSNLQLLNKTKIIPVGDDLKAIFPFLN